MPITYDKAILDARVRLMANVNDRAAEAMRQHEEPYVTATRKVLGRHAAASTVALSAPYTLRDLAPYMTGPERPGLDGYSYTPYALPGVAGDSTAFATNGHVLFAIGMEGFVDEADTRSDWQIPGDADVPKDAPVTVDTFAAYGKPNRLVPAAQRVMPSPTAFEGYDVTLPAATVKTILTASKYDRHNTDSYVVLSRPDFRTGRVVVAIQMVGPRTLGYALTRAHNGQDADARVSAHVTFTLGYFAQGLRAVTKYGSGDVRLFTADTHGLGPATMLDAHSEFGAASSVFVVMPRRVDNPGAIVSTAEDYGNRPPIQVPKDLPVTWTTEKIGEYRRVRGRLAGPGDHVVIADEVRDGGWEIHIGPRPRSRRYAYVNGDLRAAKQRAALILYQLGQGVAEPLVPIRPSI